MLGGDVNATVHRIPALAEAIGNLSLIDVGANCAKYGTPDNQPTCRANSASQANRRDFVFANSEGNDLVIGFEIDSTSKLPVHGVLRLRLRKQNDNKLIGTVQMPNSIHSILDDKCRNAPSNQGSDPVSDNKSSKGKGNEQYTCNNIISTHNKPKFKPKRIHDKEFEEMLDKIYEDYDDQCIKNKHEDDKKNYSAECKQYHLNELHKQMDIELRNIDNDLRNALHNKHTQTYIQIFSTAIEQATIKFGDLAQDQAHKVQGRSTINVVYRSEKSKCFHNTDTNDIESPCNGHDLRILKQMRRIKHINNCTQRRNKTP